MRHAEHGEKDRVGQGADDAALELGLLVGELGDALQGLFQKAALAAGADDAARQVGERPRVAGHRLGQRIALGDAGVQVVDDLA